MEKSKFTLDYLPEEPKQSGFAEGARILGGLASRAGERIAGFPGDISSLSESVSRGARAAGSWLTGGAISTEDEMQQWQKEQARALAEQTGVPFNENTDFGYRQLPTSSELREYNKSLTGDTFEPKSELEDFGQELTSDIVGFLTDRFTGKPNIPFSGSLKRAVKIAGAGNLGKQAIKRLTGSEGAGDAVKIGTMIVGSMLGNKQQLREFEEKIHPLMREGALGLEGSAKPYETMINEFIETNNLGRGLKNLGTKRDVMDVIDEIRTTFKDGKFNIGEGMETLKNLYDMGYRGGNLRNGRQLTDAGREVVQGLAGKFADQLRKSVSRFPKLKSMWQPIQDLTSGLNASGVVEDFAKKNFNVFNNVNPLTAAAFGLGGSLIGGALKGVVGGPIGATVGALGGLAVNEGSKLAKLLMKSSIARKHYSNALQAAFNNNATAFGKAVEQFNKTVEQYEPEDFGEDSFTLDYLPS